MENFEKIVPLFPEKKAVTANSVWTFNRDATENWAYWNDAFTVDECKKIIEIGQKKSVTKATVKNNDTVDEVRKSNIAWLYPSDNMEWAYLRLTEIAQSLNERFFKFNLFGMVEGLQFTCYDAPDGFYGMHIDKFFNGTIRKLSITVQLSNPEEYDGGELVLHYGKTPEVMEKQQGKLIAFPSYALHEVRPVTRGTRYSLVAWITGEPFK